MEQEADVQMTRQPVRSAYVIFTDTICQGTIPAWYDDSGYPVVYSTELEAQKEIADDLIIQLQQFMRGERDFDDAVAIEDFIRPVDVWADGSISTEDGQVFGKRQ